MAGNVKPIPDNYHSVTPYLVVDGAAKAIDFYKRAFGATELMRMPAPEDKIGHAEIKIGDSVVMLCDPMKEMGHKTPKTLGGTPVTLLIYSEDVDATVAEALKAGAQALRPVEDQFWGDRMGSVTDPVRPPVVRRDPHRGRVPRGDGAANGSVGRRAQVSFLGPPPAPSARAEREERRGLRAANTDKNTDGETPTTQIS